MKIMINKMQLKRKNSGYGNFKIRIVVLKYIHI